MKHCDAGNHDVSQLWRSRTKSQQSACKDCAMKEKATKEPKYVKVASSNINVVSEKQAKRLAEYRKIRDKFLEENPFCKVCGTPHSITLHHMMGRIGDLLTDTSNFVTLCVKHHERAEREPWWAKEIGISKSRLEE